MTEGLPRDVGFVSSKQTFSQSLSPLSADPLIARGSHPSVYHYQGLYAKDIHSTGWMDCWDRWCATPIATRIKVVVWQSAETWILMRPAGGTHSPQRYALALELPARLLSIGSKHAPRKKTSPTRISASSMVRVTLGTESTSKWCFEVSPPTPVKFPSKFGLTTHSHRNIILSFFSD